MYIGKQSIGICRNVERVYEVAKTYPRFVSFFLDGSKILSEDEQRLLVEVHSRLFGLRTSWRGEGIKLPYKAIRFTQTKGLFKGLKARWSFVSKTPTETKVTICTSFRKGPLTPLGERLLGAFVVEKVTTKILAELKRRSEEELVQCDRCLPSS